MRSVSVMALAFAVESLVDGLGVQSDPRRELARRRLTRWLSHGNADLGRVVADLRVLRKGV